MPRRFQFSLRTMFVVMTIAAVLLAVAVPVTRYLFRDRELEWLMRPSPVRSRVP